MTTLSELIDDGRARSFGPDGNRRSKHLHAIIAVEDTWGWIPIPTNFHVRNIATASGIVDRGADDDTIRAAWAEVLAIVNDTIASPTNLLRIDSIAWQIGNCA